MIAELLVGTALIQPINLPRVETYQEARALLRWAGRYVTASAAPDSAGTPQDMVKNTLLIRAGRGFSGFIEKTPADPQPSGFEFEWLPGEELKLTFPGDKQDYDPAACKVVQDLAAASTWASTAASTKGLDPAEIMEVFNTQLPQWNSRTGQASFTEKGEILLETLFSNFYYLGLPVFKEVEIQWGAALQSCLTTWR